MKTIETLELAQIAWVVRDIRKAAAFIAKALGVRGFGEPQHMRAQDLNMSYRSKVVPAEWLTAQAHNGVAFVELIQPLSGQSMFHDYLEKHPQGGVQHVAYRLPVADFERITGQFRDEGYEVISEVDHPIARMAFFDTYDTLGVVTEIMGITPDGWKAVKQMENNG